jgi:signal peptidase
LEGWKQYLNYFLFFIVLAAVALGGMQVLKATFKTKYPVMVVVSQSMVPTLGVGDFILVGQIQDFEEVVAAPNPEGDILVFLSPWSTDEYVVHRAIDKMFIRDEWMFITKGDNNAVEDSRPVAEEGVVGKVIGRIPVLGYFPLFIKTSRGFLFVGSLMAVVFFADFLMPDNREEEAGGKFPWLSLVPFVVSPLVLGAFILAPDTHFEYEMMALGAWYAGCVIAPLAFDDDDMSMMFWLYHFVLIMIPLTNDIVWWMTNYSPSLWWNVEGSTVPITWLLRRETPFFYQVFNKLAYLLLPGCIIFFVLTALKRRGIGPLMEFSRRIRGL